MEVHQLRYVTAVARTKNFSRAAELCHVSQPSLSQQIQKLEEELGQRLFDRLKRETKLTPAGEAFLPRATRILEEVEAARREAHEAGELLRGTLALGVLPTIAPYLLPPIVTAFTKRFPGVELVIQEDTTDQVLKQLLSCDLDLGLASQPIHDPRFEVRHLFTEELLLAIPPGHRLAKQRTVTASELDTERLITMKEGHCLGDQVLRFCERRELHPTVTFRSAQIATVQALVHAGQGVSLIPAMAVMPDCPNAPVYRSLKGPRPEREIVAVWQRQRPPTRAAAEFLNIAEAQRSGASNKGDGRLVVRGEE